MPALRHRVRRGRGRHRDADAGEEPPQNKKNILAGGRLRQVRLLRLCVDACPFDALSMTNDYELSAYDKASLKYTPDMLISRRPKPSGPQGEVRPEEGHRDTWLTYRRRPSSPLTVVDRRRGHRRARGQGDNLRCGRSRRQLLRRRLALLPARLSLRGRLPDHGLRGRGRRPPPLHRHARQGGKVVRRLDWARGARVVGLVTVVALVALPRLGLRSRRASRPRRSRPPPPSFVGIGELISRAVTPPVLSARARPGGGRAGGATLAKR